MTRLGSQRHKKKELHLVGYYHHRITMHGFTNVKITKILTKALRVTAIQAVAHQ